MNHKADEPWTVLRLMDWTTEYLEGNGSESPRLDAEVLLAKVRRCSRIDLYTDFDQVASDPERSEFKALVRRRAAGEPVAYLVGQKEFYSRNFEVSPAVLIPRADTETLIVEALDWIARDGSKAPRIADIGTGSGILAITIALECQHCSVFATDVELAALEIARKNAVHYDVERRIAFECGAFFAAAEVQPFDLVVSNPPYVSTSEYAELASTVRNYEPQTALLAGPQGTECIEALLEEAAARVRSGGACVVEISPMIEEAVRERVAQHAAWGRLKVLKDHAGQSRVIAVEHT